MPLCPNSSGLKKCSTPDNATFADNLSIDRLVSLMQLGLISTDQPLALFCGLHKPHLPFRRPRSFDKLYPNWNTTDLALHRVIPDGTPLIAWHDTGDNKDPWTPHPVTDERETRHAYRATVSFADSMVGRVLDGLDAAGIANDTAVFLWSDHGWQLSEHGQWRKMTIFELATRVPLMIHVPWLPQGHGKRTSAIAELVDMMPTAAAVMGIDLMANETIDGTSLLPVLTDPTASVKDSAFSQYPRCPKNVSVPWRHNACLQVNDTDFYAMGYSLRADGWRYSEWIEWDGSSTTPNWSDVVGVELYSHQDDLVEKDFNTFENENLAGQDKYKTIQAQLSERLRAHYQADGCTPFVNCE
jgi:iduronate 2-sulfatase